jgi:hypothetical protein
MTGRMIVRVMDEDLHCVECGVASGLLARGWLAVRCDDPDHVEPPLLAFYCRDCARAQFGVKRRRRSHDD